MYERILICTDGTPLSNKAVESGIALAVKLTAEVFPFMVVPHYPSMYFEGAMVLTPAETERVEKEWNAQAQTVVDSVQKEAATQGVKATAITGHGAVAESIINAAKKHRCDLIVMASHGRKGISRVLLGSETMDVLTHSHIPVLILR
ncbi:MAG: universal stress protein [Burkholderiaceae bacterium]